MTAILSFFLIVVLPLLAVEPDEEVWATNDVFGTRLVPIYYVDQPVTTQGDEVLGLYNPNDDHIEIKIGYADVWARQGGNIRDHEILHAWGYSHVDMWNDFNIDDPRENLLAGIYDPTNFEHSDPRYEHVPFDSSCPRCKD